VLREEHAPLVLAGVDYLLPIYREANTYPNLVDEGIEGSPEALGEKEIHRQAWDIVRPIIVAEQREAMDRYQALADTGDERASNDPAAIVSAAHHGRVETLFVATDHHLWGSLGRNANEVQAREEREPGDQDLLDYAAVQVLVNGGTVYALSLEEMPGGGAASAVFRY
jgi:hypothetical protein